MTRYTKWRKPRGGVKREDGTNRTCMHCSKGAVHAAVRKDKFVMDVWFCPAHASTAKEVDSKT